jgi:hypothetical protein
MSKKEIKTVLDRVLTWPRERQEDVAQVLLNVGTFKSSDCELQILRVYHHARAAGRSSSNDNPLYAGTSGICSFSLTPTRFFLRTVAARTVRLVGRLLASNHCASLISILSNCSCSQIPVTTKTFTVS